MTTTIEQAYLDLIELMKLFGEPLVIRGHENAPQPKGEYTSILLISEDTQGTAGDRLEGIDDETLLHSVAQTSHLTFSVQMYRGAPLARARSFLLFLYTEGVKNFCVDRKISIKDSTSPRRTSYGVSNNWVPRASFEIILSETHKMSEEIGTIDEIDVVTKADPELVDEINIKEDE